MLGLPYIQTSEGGHYPFSPEADWKDSIKLVKHIQKVQSNENLLSHRGIKKIYNYFLYEAKKKPNYKYTYKKIIQLALSGNNEAVDTLKFICEYLGALSGNMANVFNCNDSIFVWSYTLKDIQIDFLRDHFQERFSDRPKHGTKICKIPVFLIMNDNFPLYGCAYYSECYVNNLNKKNS